MEIRPIYGIKQEAAHPILQTRVYKHASRP